MPAPRGRGGDRGGADHRRGDRAAARDGLPKGDALATARIAGIMGAKRTPDLVPLCHPIALTGVKVDLALADDRGARSRPP